MTTLVHAANGTTIRTLGPTAVETAAYCSWWAGGYQSVMWDGRADDGTVAPDGEYSVAVSYTHLDVYKRQPLLSVLSALSATMREVAAMRYQFDAPFVMDSSAALNELGLAPTAWDEVCRRTAAG